MDRRSFIQGLGSAGIATAFIEPGRAAPGRDPAQRIGPISRKRVVKVCGIGSGGCDIVNRLILENIADVAEYVCIATSQEDMRRSQARRKLFIDAGEFPTGAAVARAMKNPVHLEVLLHGAEIVLMVAGNGGEIEERLMTFVGWHAKRTGLQVASLLVMPFYHRGFELGTRHAMVLPQIQSHVSMVVSSESLDCSLGQDRTEAEEMALTEQATLRAVEALIGITTRGPGILNVDAEAVRMADARKVGRRVGQAIVREIEQCAAEAEVAVVEMGQVAARLQESISSLLAAADGYHLAAEGVHAALGASFQRKACLARMESLATALEAQAQKVVQAASVDDSILPELQARREALELVAGELERWSNNTRHFMDEIDRVRDAIDWWGGGVRERLAELDGLSAPQVSNLANASDAVTYARSALERAQAALSDVEPVVARTQATLEDTRIRELTRSAKRDTGGFWS